MKIKPAVVILLVVLRSGIGLAQPVIYPAPMGVSPSEDFRVWIDGREAFVYSSPVPAAYCSFDIHGPVNVTIKANRDIKWVDIRPLSSRINPVFKDSTITFRCEKPLQLSIELNGSLRTPLFLFANPPEERKPPETDSTVIYFGAGKVHHAGLITLKSNQSVYVEGGAVVKGTITAENAKNIRIYGHGILEADTNRRMIELINCENVSISGVTIHNNPTWQVVPVSCRDLVIDNIKILSDRPSDDGIDVVHSRNVIIKNSFIRTKDDCIAVKAYIKEPDAQPVDNLLVEHCVFWNALWGNALELGFELNAVDVKNISFKDCDIIHVEAGAAISIHNAGKSSVSNILFENIRIEDARQKLFDLAIFRSQYSEDGTRDTSERKRLYLHGAWDGVLTVPATEKKLHAQFRGKIRNVTFRDINVVDGPFPFSIFCGSDDTHLVSDITIENLLVHKRKIRTMAEAKLYVENTENITIR